jgi:phosphoribosylaminoimidazole-succinocarboxamide synthase
VELVVRGYLAGSLLREPREDRGHAYGVRIDPALGDYRSFPAPIVTPTTKEAVGKHDEPSSLHALVASGRVSQVHLDRMVEAATELFTRGARFARENGLLLVDTKYEFGLIDGRVVLIDEVHTADSSRFWVADTYETRLAESTPPDMLDKERLRRWLLAQGFSGHGAPPALSDDIRVDLAAHYWSLTERLLGRTFTPHTGDPVARVSKAVRSFLDA